jgi:hypothetical protein
MMERPFEYEGKTNFDWNHATNGWWITIETISTVGYGEGYPGTHIGRFSMVVVAIFGSFLISLAVHSLEMYNSLSKRERIAVFLI